MKKSIIIGSKMEQILHALTHRTKAEKILIYHILSMYLIIIPVFGVVAWLWDYAIIYQLFLGSMIYWWVMLFILAWRLK